MRYNSTVHAGHGKVEKHEVDRVGSKKVKGLFAIRRAEYVVTSILQQFMTGEENSCLVINRQDERVAILKSTQKRKLPLQRLASHTDTPTGTNLSSTYPLRGALSVWYQT